jgi:hypothetical protein
MRTYFGAREYLEHENTTLRNKIIFNSHWLIKTLGDEYFMENINKKYEDLLKHEDENIRVKIAENIDQVVEAFGTISAYKNEIEKHVITLMLDKSPSVVGVLLVHLDKIVDVLIPDELTEEMIELGIDKKKQAFKTALSKNLIKMEDIVKNNWRHLIRWIDFVFKVITIYDSSTIVKKFIPIVITHLKKGGRETRKF